MVITSFKGKVLACFTNSNKHMCHFLVSQIFCLQNTVTSNRISIALHVQCPSAVWVPGCTPGTPCRCPRPPMGLLTQQLAAQDLQACLHGIM